MQAINVLLAAKEHFPGLKPTVFHGSSAYATWKIGDLYFHLWLAPYPQVNSASKPIYNVSASIYRNFQHTFPPTSNHDPHTAINQMVSMILDTIVTLSKTITPDLFAQAQED